MPWLNTASECLPIYDSICSQESIFLGSDLGFLILLQFEQIGKKLSSVFIRCWSLVLSLLILMRCFPIITPDMPPNKTGTINPFIANGEAPKAAFWKTERNESNIAPKQNETIKCHRRLSLVKNCIIFFIFITHEIIQSGSAPVIRSNWQVGGLECKCNHQ